ncbi:MAG: type II secretion system protein N [Spongiibacteraceae bacterium]
MMLQKSALLEKMAGSRLLSLLSLLMAVMLIYMTAGAFWKAAALYRDITPSVVSPTVSSATGNRRKSPSYNLQTMLAVPLFGVLATPEDDAKIQENVRASKLKITVVGLVSASENGGVAILKYGSKTKAYVVGEKIAVPGNVSLVAILADHIIIENNRRQEKITLQKSVAISGVRSAAQVDVSTDSINLNSSEIRKLIGDPRETIQKSPLRLARFFAVSPVNENGAVIGYSLKPGRDKRLFSQLGIVAGDVVMSVNGQSMSGLSTPDLLKLLENTSSFDLLVKRGDTVLNKRLDL